MTTIVRGIPLVSEVVVTSEIVTKGRVICDSAICLRHCIRLFARMCLKFNDPDEEIATYSTDTCFVFVPYKGRPSHRMVVYPFLPRWDTLEFGTELIYLDDTERLQKLEDSLFEEYMDLCLGVEIHRRYDLNKDDGRVQINLVVEGAECGNFLSLPRPDRSSNVLSDAILLHESVCCFVKCVRDTAQKSRLRYPTKHFPTVIIAPNRFSEIIFDQEKDVLEDTRDSSLGGIDLDDIWELTHYFVRHPKAMNEYMAICFGFGRRFGEYSGNIVVES